MRFQERPCRICAERRIVAGRELRSETEELAKRRTSQRVAGLRRRARCCACLTGLVVGVSLVFVSRIEASLIKAKSVELSDIREAIALARDGDTVAIPSGMAEWSEMVDIRHSIILQGAGSTQTTIRDNFARTRSGKNLIRFSVTKDLPFGLRGVTIEQGSEVGASGSGIVAVFGGTGGTMNPAIPGISGELRIADVKFDYPDGGPAVMIRITDAIGVVDHCTFNSQNQFLTVYHPHWMGGTYGNGSWADDPTWGSGRFLFVEDCNVMVKGKVIRSSDSDNGARYVARYCTFNNAGVTAHGTEASGRGTKQLEIYNNTFNNTTSQTGFPQLRSGSVLIHDNVMNGYERGMAFQTYRFFDLKQHWGVVTGVNGYDVNATDGPLGGSLYATGTHTGPGSSGVLVDSTKTWSSTQWKTDGFAYVISNTSRIANPSYITSVTGTHQMDFAIGSVSAPRIPMLFFNTGDHYEIRKVLKALDQPGQGKGDLKSGTDYLPALPPNTTSEPCYSWNNWTSSAHTVQLDFNNLTPTLKSGRDYFNRTAKPGYKPYVYPHPLTRKSAIPPRSPGAS